MPLMRWRQEAGRDPTSKGAQCHKRGKKCLNYEGHMHFFLKSVPWSVAMKKILWYSFPKFGKCWLSKTRQVSPW